MLSDWSKGFDRVLHDKLWEAVAKYGVSAGPTAAAQSMYWSPLLRAALDGGTLCWHMQGRGIRQGCRLSPFPCVITVPAFWADIHVGFAGGRSRLEGWDLGFGEIVDADDIALLAETEAQAEVAHSVIDEAAVRCDICLNRPDCELLALCRRCKVRYGRGENLPQVNEPAKCVGRHAYATGRVARDVGKRTGDAH